MYRYGACYGKHEEGMFSRHDDVGRWELHVCAKLTGGQQHGACTAISSAKERARE